MGSPFSQPSLFDGPDRTEDVKALLLALEREPLQPSAAELLDLVGRRLDLRARWDLEGAIKKLLESGGASQALRSYLRWVLDDLAALAAGHPPGGEPASSIDALFEQSRRYRGGRDFQKMVEFMGRFRDYSPFNNMLVRLQNPGCSFYATARDWRARFGRALREDARPMLILAPMHPLMLVYDLDQTEGPDPPMELRQFGLFGGPFEGRWLERLVENARRHRIEVQFKPLSSTNAGRVGLGEVGSGWKMRVVVHDRLDGPSRFGALCHELAHVLLGHLGTDADRWWPARPTLGRDAMEVEAEAVCWIVTTHLGMDGSSSAYVSRHLPAGEVPAGLSIDMIGKTAGLIERMATESVTPRQRRSPAEAGRTDQPESSR